MAALFNIEVTGSDAVLKGLAALQDAVQDLTPYWRDVFAPKYFGIVQDLFSTSGTPRGEGGKFSGGPWERLSPAYAKWKFAHYPGRPTLSLTGTLRKSLYWTGSGLGQGGIFEATPTFVRVGTEIPYAKYHQYGTGKMPKRAFMPEPDLAVFGPLLKQWLMKAHASATK
jgi:phage gpG-like protein